MELKVDKTGTYKGQDSNKMPYIFQSYSLYYTGKVFWSTNEIPSLSNIFTFCNICFYFNPCTLWVFNKYLVYIFCNSFKQLISMQYGVERSAAYAHSITKYKILAYHWVVQMLFTLLFVMPSSTSWFIFKNLEVLICNIQTL